MKSNANRQYLRAFNTLFFDFIDFIISVVPENELIISSRQFYESVKKTNPTIIVKVWYEHIYVRYQQIIDDGDVEFFVEKDYRADLADFTNSNEIVKMIEQIRSPIKNMSEENKRQSMLFIQKLGKLATLYKMA
jgi:hypothetical protein